ncbi:transcriptional regulator, TetR family [Nocardia amikacinitolerans]|uniref:TetR/AcrR family transcriptional regulator n=1 Tax=Nocardia amikacinitolerans TaxID=756689 RepID=UPI000831CFF1|nr:TetR/AcrR family transcriptional regulator [Nocardia amikacinitolerans]MCP2315803.1 transcriptional regulator, TetR family [Nocardia amikacinitolerans]
MTEPPPRRAYDSLRRHAQAQRTRVEIADAARRLFVSQGWASTTVRDVAREAGVSVPTVYAAYGNKAGLVWALVDAADLSADLPRLLTELDESPTPARQLAAMAGYDRRLLERAGDLVALIREAGRTEADFATVYGQVRRAADRVRAEVFETWPDDALRPGVDRSTALDVYAALCNIDVYTTLTVERGWRPDRVERWWGEALTRQLLRG